MIYLKTFDHTTNEERENLFYCWGDVWTALFSPEVEQITILEFKTHGKNYKERREHLRQLAIDFQQSENGNGLYYSDIVNIQAFFQTFGGRYGLLKEFHANGIC